MSGNASCYFIEKKQFLSIFSRVKQTANLRKECAQKGLEQLKKLTRIVFNKWYAETLQQNQMVIPDEAPEAGEASPPRSPEQQQESLGTLPTEQQPVPADLPESPSNLHIDHAAPVERMQVKSQLESLEPVQIARSRAFFGKNTFLLRDQLSEYVAGFPAAKNHQKVVEKHFGRRCDSQSVEESQSEAKKKVPEPEEPAEPFPVDKAKLKNAIKAALIKNDNDPAKLDLGVILREQMKL